MWRKYHPETICPGVALNCEQPARCTEYRYAEYVDNSGAMGEDDGAASVIRTRDLTLTKGALYRWSYGSIFSIPSLVKTKGHNRGGILCREFLTGT